MEIGIACRCGRGREGEWSPARRSRVSGRRRSGHAMTAPEDSLQVLINVDVSDLQEAIRFYSEGIGLRVGRRFGESGVEMIGASSAIFLLAKPDGSPAFPGEAAPPRSYRRHWTPVHLDFLCADVEGAVERARAAGAILEKPVARHAWGSIALLSDPFGHGFCLIQLTERGYDAVAT